MKTIQNRTTVFYYNVVYQYSLQFTYIGLHYWILFDLTSATLNLIIKLLTISQCCMAGILMLTNGFLIPIYSVIMTSLTRVQSKFL